MLSFRWLSLRTLKSNVTINIFATIQCLNNSKSSHALDPRRKQEEGTTKRDVEKVRGARDEGSRVGLGPGRKAVSGQNTMAFLGFGLMCERARRGLSK